MKFYIVDDDISIIRILTKIIEGNSSFEVVGSSCSPKEAYDNIIIIKPDIVLVDLLMPEMDGNVLVREIKNMKPEIHFIMISQVMDSQLRSESYEAGIEFFINKPINRIEVKNVIEKVAEKIEVENMLYGIKNMLKIADKSEKDNSKNLNKIKHVLGLLGMLGEKGTNDILKIGLYILENNISFSQCNLEGMESYLNDNPQIVKQRIRRAIKGGMVNVANMGIEDYSNEVFNSYASVLFDFASVKAEMDYINGKSKIGGKISINKFFDGLMLVCENN